MELVEELAEKARDGVNVQILKVKSHIGIEGNHWKTRRRQTTWNTKHAGHESATTQPEKGLKDIYWPHLLGRKIHNAAGGAAAIVMNGQGKEQVSQPNMYDKPTPQSSL